MYIYIYIYLFIYLFIYPIHPNLNPNVDLARRSFLRPRTKSLRNARRATTRHGRSYTLGGLQLDLRDLRLIHVKVQHTVGK